MVHVRSLQLPAWHRKQWTSEGRASTDLQQISLGIIRRIGKSPQHVTHEPTRAVLQRLGLQAPSKLLQDRWNKTFTKFHAVCGGLSKDDFLHRIPIGRIQQRVMQVFQESDHPPEPGADVVPTQLACTYCNQVFDSQAMLHRHLSKRHKATPNFERFVNLRDALQGKPQCTHCNKKFALWTGLIHDIEFTSCPSFDLHKTWQVPPCDQEDLRQYVSWEALCGRQDLIEWFRSHCVVCARAFQNGKDILRHLARCHHSMWEASKSRMAEIVIRLNTTKACLACGLAQAATHSCHVLRQFAIVLIMCEQDLWSQDLLKEPVSSLAPAKPDPDNPLPENVKRRKIGPTTAKERDFQPARDSADGTPTCSHCMRTLASFISLRNHIENGCRHFTANRPPGNHVPCLWPQLQRLSQVQDVDPIQLHFVWQAISETGWHCTALGTGSCGTTWSCTGIGIQISNIAVASGKPCLCGNHSTKRGHKCVVFTHLALLHLASSQQSATEKSAPAQASPSPMAPQDYWDDKQWCLWLSNHCSVCNMACTPKEIVEHLQQCHGELIPDAVEALPHCLSPTPFCCSYCWQASEIIDSCPLSLNLAVHWWSHASLRDLSRRHDGANLGHLRQPDRRVETAIPEKTETRAGLGIKRHLRPTAKPDPDASLSGPSTRESAPGDCNSGHLHSVPTTGPVQSHPVDSAVNATMEARCGKEAGHNVPTTEVDHHDHSNPRAWKEC